MKECSKITFELAAVPRAIRDDFSRTLALAVDAYFKKPGVEEDFQRWLIDYKKRGIESPAEKLEA